MRGRRSVSVERRFADYCWVHGNVAANVVGSADDAAMFPMGRQPMRTAQRRICRSIAARCRRLTAVQSPVMTILFAGPTANIVESSDRPCASRQVGCASVVDPTRKMADLGRETVRSRTIMSVAKGRRCEFADPFNCGPCRETLDSSAIRPAADSDRDERQSPQRPKGAVTLVMPSHAVHSSALRRRCERFRKWPFASEVDTPRCIGARVPFRTCRARGG
ncbi:hypothetical protein AWB75_06236 [Caballeronia catudaia]|uniref:Uncharacterized protein n=1 Tax=Caballeronia catudaia TaxID=1777136 RepID=A0A158D5B4_9BURK|nr:hypothetical protein AWB75_06236 [Caballeronia catudaia]